MTKAIGLFLLLAMVVQIIRPLGLPGLKKEAIAGRSRLPPLSSGR
ncbi:hypothetical protein V2V90_03530 [Agrobacterium leguminum]